MIKYELIENDQDLVNVCSRFRAASALAVDTEFVRTRTLYPQLGLVQVYDGANLALIDTVNVKDLSPLVALLVDKDIVKVLHACSEDLEAFIHNLNITPAPIFDTQTAAGLLKMGQSLGYAKLIETLQGVIVDKGESRTDWIARPLRLEQLSYAAADVYYLLPAYQTLRSQCDEQGKTEFVFSEAEIIASKKQASLPSEFAYLTIKNAWKLSGNSLTALQALAKWRIERAKQKDIAINFVLREQAMVSMAMKLPKHTAQLSNIEGLSPRDIRKHGATWLSIIEASTSEETKQIPAKTQRLVDFKDYKKALADLKLIANEIAAEHELPIENVASKKQLEQWLKWAWFDLDQTELSDSKPDIVSGWRAALFRPKLENMFAKTSRKYHALRSI